MNEVVTVTPADDSSKIEIILCKIEKMERILFLMQIETGDTKEELRELFADLNALDKQLGKTHGFSCARREDRQN